MQWANSSGPTHQSPLGDSLFWYPKGANIYLGKLKNKWFGPYRVQYPLPDNTILLVAIEKFDPDPIIVNINKPKPYRYLNNDQLLQAARRAPEKSAILLQPDTQDKEEVNETPTTTNFIAVVLSPQPALNDRLL